MNNPCKISIIWSAEKASLLDLSISEVAMQGYVITSTIEQLPDNKVQYTIYFTEPLGAYLLGRAQAAAMIKLRT